jgi:hypothetical protein
MRCLKLTGRESPQDLPFAFYNTYAHAGQAGESLRISHLLRLERQFRKDQGLIITLGDWNSFYHETDRFYFSGPEHDDSQVHHKEKELWSKICRERGLLELPQRDQHYTHIHNSHEHASRLSRVYSNIHRSSLLADGGGVRTDPCKPPDISDHFLVYCVSEAPPVHHGSFLYRFPALLLSHPHAEPMIRECFRALVRKRTGCDPFTNHANDSL